MSFSHLLRESTGAERERSENEATVLCVSEYKRRLAVTRHGITWAPGTSPRVTYLFGPTPGGDNYIYPGVRMAYVGPRNESEDDMGGLRGSPE